MVVFKKIVMLILLLVITGYSQNRVFTDVNIDGDNDATSSYKYYLGYNRDITDVLHFGVMAGNRNYVDPGLHNSFRDLRLNGQYAILDNLEITTNVSFLFSNDWKPIFYDGLITYNPIDMLYFEGYIEHESVGTEKTNEQKYISTYSGMSVDISVLDELVLVAGFSYNEITDNNYRLYQTYRAVYTLPLEWVFVDFKTKLMTGGDYSPYYFSPNTLSEYNFGIGIRGELGSPRYYSNFYIGGGVQKVNNDLKGLFITNLRIGADFTPTLSGELILGATNAQNNVYGSFWYNYGKLKLTYSF